MLLLMLQLPTWSWAQVAVNGRVLNSNGIAVSKATIYAAQLKISTQSDSSGTFSLSIPENLPYWFFVKHPDYSLDSFLINTTSPILTLRSLQVVEGAKVSTGNQRFTSLIGNQTIKTEIITSGELKKAACCDLAGCFETQGTVQPMTTNIITNAKELRILGLSGVYNQVLIDGIPLIQGLSYTYGISSIPGTLVDNIFVSKGTTSVLQGFESMVGQINVIPKNPDKSEKLLINVYVNSFGENHYNFNFKHGKGKWRNLVAGQVVQPAQKWDRDKDNFLDLPQLRRYMLYDKIQYGNENKPGISSTIGIKLLSENRSGGQWQYNQKTDTGSTSVYGQSVKYLQGELYSKTSLMLKNGNKFALMAATLQHQQNSWFGTVYYKARQYSSYANLQYEHTWRNHDFKSGVSFRQLNINENIRFSDTSLKRTYQGQYLKDEIIPGLFAENTFKWRADIITLITGLRIDHHNQFGWMATPRMMLKYDISENSILRTSAGSGWRTVNLFSENNALMASSRNIVFKEALQPEKSINWGINYFKKLKAKKLEGYFTIDFYQTRFQNQFFPDYDSDPRLAYIGNFTGKSVANGFQTDLNIKLYKIIEVKAAYNYLDVFRVNNAVKTQLPFNAKHKFLMAISYLPKNKKWRSDLNIHWFGKQRLPNTDQNPDIYRQAPWSKAYTTFNLQFTRSWKKLELYGGAENIFDYRQLQPIVSWQNPFSPYFDTSFNWGPTRGRELYIGVRYKPFEKSK